MSITKPTFVVVTGVAHTPAHTQSLVESLNTKGYFTEPVAHPTIGPLAASAPPNADAANLRKILENLIINQQKDVVLLCHAYGGMVGSQSVNGLERSARAKAGRKGGIVKVVFITALLPQEGESMLQIFGETGMEPREWLDMDSVTGTFSANSLAADTLYHDLPHDQAQYWASKLEPMSGHAGISPATDVCWSADVPKVYIFCKTDRVFSLGEQRRMLERVQGDQTDDWETYEMDCGHSPILSHVEELTEILTKE
ncbi:AB hydrolase-1 domain-containing protein [Mycena venus]|uniref:AB hydrolase-1 domain-containing protein n=1 Tax=Mycena venus TaxID=2733690 RepID=A0A8H6YRX4_9AGAR|nr:AB hydrolase-1 domain-containing protein [Mycena venus]